MAWPSSRTRFAIRRAEIIGRPEPRTGSERLTGAVVGRVAVTDSANMGSRASSTLLPAPSSWISCRVSQHRSPHQSICRAPLLPVRPVGRLQTIDSESITLLIEQRQWRDGARCRAAAEGAGPAPPPHPAAVADRPAARLDL